MAIPQFYRDHAGAQTRQFVHIHAKYSRKGFEGDHQHVIKALLPTLAITKNLNHEISPFDGPQPIRNKLSAVGATQKLAWGRTTNETGN